VEKRFDGRAKSWSLWMKSRGILQCNF